MGSTERKREEGSGGCYGTEKLMEEVGGGEGSKVEKSSKHVLFFRQEDSTQNP